MLLSTVHVKREEECKQKLLLVGLGWFFHLFAFGCLYNTHMGTGASGSRNSDTIYL